MGDEPKNNVDAFVDEKFEERKEDILNFLDEIIDGLGLIMKSKMIGTNVCIGELCL